MDETKAGEASLAGVAPLLPLLFTNKGKSLVAQTRAKV
jgi:hypothetical protein